MLIRTIWILSYLLPVLSVSAGDTDSCVSNEQCAYNHRSQCRPADAYLGSKAVTRTGTRCQSWTSDEVHVVHRDYLRPENMRKYHIGDHNLCRTVTFEAPWCYTTDKNVKWDYCYHNCTMRDGSFMEPSSCRFIPGKEISPQENTIKELSGKEHDCCRYCDDHVDCVGYTWKNVNEGTCYLKNKKGPLVDAEIDTVSGLVNHEKRLTKAKTSSKGGFNPLVFVGGVAVGLVVFAAVVGALYFARKRSQMAKLEADATYYHVPFPTHIGIENPVYPFNTTASPVELSTSPSTGQVN